jgi:hypothetical protein
VWGIAHEAMSLQTRFPTVPVISRLCCFGESSSMCLCITSLSICCSIDLSSIPIGAVCVCGLTDCSVRIIVPVGVRVTDTVPMGVLCG